MRLGAIRPLKLLLLQGVLDKSNGLGEISINFYKVNYTPNADCGDYLVIINSDKIKLTGKKIKDKIYYKHTGFPGGQKRITPTEMLVKDKTSVVKHAIKGMLPKNKLGRAILKNCHIYAGTEHANEAQKPQQLNLNDLK